MNQRSRTKCFGSYGGIQEESGLTSLRGTLVPAKNLTGFYQRYLSLEKLLFLKILEKAYWSKF